MSYVICSTNSKIQGHFFGMRISLDLYQYPIEDKVNNYRPGCFHPQVFYTTLDRRTLGNRRTMRTAGMTQKRIGEIRILHLQFGGYLLGRCHMSVMYSRILKYLGKKILKFGISVFR